jgi:hypothetical protein
VASARAFAKPPGLQAGGSSSIRKTSGLTFGTTYVTMFVAPPTLVTCPGSSPLSTNAEPAPYVSWLQSEFQTITAPDFTDTITKPGW